MMQPLDSLALVLVSAVGCQWLASRLRLPALILLLGCGLLLGPVSHLLVPAVQFGDLLMPVVKIGVAIILFEGGLNLHFHELQGNGRAIRRLSTVGIPAAWLLGSAASHYIGGLPWPIAALFGAIIVVTGPTVILPLLRHARLKQKPAALLKWEGIVNDPLGAVLAVLVFQWILHGSTDPQQVLFDLGMLALAGVAGIGLGYFTGWAFRSGQVSEHLKGPLLISLVPPLYVLSNHLLEEAGLLAVTLMGLTIGNMQLPSVTELRRFKEYVTLILVSVLFVVLSANIDPQSFQLLTLRSLALIAALLFVVRPLAILIATQGTELGWRERLLPAWIAPRGIVAAAVAGVFAPELAAHNVPGAELLVPLTFSLIVVTVVIHGLTIAPWARLLGLANPSHHGLLVVGASPWSSELCRLLHELGVTVLLVDSAWQRLRKARLAGVPVYYGQLLSPEAETSLELGQLDTLLALSDNDAYNALVCTARAGEMGWQKVFQLPQGNENSPAQLQPGLHGNSAFSSEFGYEELLRRHYLGWQFQKTRLSENYTLEHWRDDLPTEAIALLCIKADGQILIASDQQPLPGGDGSTLISFTPTEALTPGHSVQSIPATSTAPPQPSRR